jgi:hypothetical protein
MPRVDRWKQRWYVQSHSNPGIQYVVAIDVDKVWGCSCPVWKFRREECKHIKEIKGSLADPRRDNVYNQCEPTIVVANVQQITFDKLKNEVQMPLIPLGETHFEATIIFDLLLSGVSYRTIRERYSLTLANTNPRRVIEGYIVALGRCIYDHWDDRIGWTGRKVVPLDNEQLEILTEMEDRVIA